jgi:hypothetical protein
MDRRHRAGDISLRRGVLPLTGKTREKTVYIEAKNIDGEALPMINETAHINAVVKKVVSTIV